MCSTPWFPLTPHALTFLSSLSLLFPSLHLLPLPRTPPKADHAEQAGCHLGHGRPGRPGAQVDSATPASRHRGHGRPGRPGDKADLATAGCRRGHGRPGRPGEKVDLADQAGCHPGSCPPGSTGASRRPGAHINCRSGTPTLHTSYVQAQSYPNGPTARGLVPTLRRDGSQNAHGRYHRRSHGCFVFCPLRQQRSFRIPLTNLDQHDGTTGPSLQPDWSFPASPVTITIFFFFIERGNFHTYWWREIGWLGEALSPLENGD